jgi:hypothetical protein
MRDLEKLKHLIHYVAWKAGKRDWFGATKLYKVLWFADARQLVLTKKPITDCAPRIAAGEGGKGVQGRDSN